MPDGMAAFFEGRYFWKMPADVQMPVGPTVIHPLPTGYMAATEKYSAQVKITELPEGALTLTGYSGGIPFRTRRNLTRDGRFSQTYGSAIRLTLP